MKKLLHQTKLLTSIILLSICGIDSLNAQTTFTESFNANLFPPTGWSTQASGPNSYWGRVTNGTNPTAQPHSGAGMARFTANGQNNGQQQALVSPIINYSGASGSTPFFSLWIYRDNSSTAGDSLTILVNSSTNVSGAIRIGAVARSRFFQLPVNELANGWYNYTFTIPASFNTDTNYIILNGTSRGGGNIYIDDLSWNEYVGSCSSPTADSVTTPTPTLCSGSGSANLSLSGSGLAFGGISLQWQSAPDSTGPWTNFGTSSTNQSTGIITVSTWYRCYVNCTTTASSDTSSAILINLLSNPNPVVIIDQGQTIDYCAVGIPLLLTASGASTYSWIPNIATNTSGDSASATPVTNTTYTIVGTDSSGCSGSTLVIVNVGTAPNINVFSNNDTICIGQSVTINAFGGGGPGGGTQYMWQPGNLSGGNQTVSPSVTTTYYVTGTNANFNCAGYDSVKIVVYNVPSANFTYLDNNPTFIFTNTSLNAISYLWDFGDGTTSTATNPTHTFTSSGIQTVTLTASNGFCSNNVITITIGTCTSPNAGNVLSNPTVICNGSGSADLTLTGAGLTLAGLDFQWQSATNANGPWTNFGLNSFNINTGIITAPTYYRCYVTCSSGATTDTSTTFLLDVNSNTNPIITINQGSSVNYCAGATPINLTANGALTYTWLPNIPTSTNGDTAFASPAVTTSYTVSGTNAFGCIGNASITINVGNALNVNAFSSTDTICNGQSLTINAFGGGGPGGGTQFVWQPGGLTGANHTVSPTVTTTYTVSATSAAATCPGYDSLTVVVYDNPIANFNYSNNGASYSFTNTSTSALTYLWDFGDGSTSTTENPNHTYSTSATVTVTLIVSNGVCAEDTFSTSLSIIVGSNKLINIKNATLFPNPVADIATLRFTNNDNSVNISILNTLGQQEFEKTIYPTSENQYQSTIDLKEFLAGIYFIKLKSKSQTSYLHLIKK